MQNKIRFVIIGSGNIANTYLKALGNIDNAEIVGIVTRGLHSKVYPEEIKIYKGLSEIRTDVFDAVIICTPNSLHHKGAIEAAQLRKHVLCEKPIDISVENIDKMIKECNNNGVKLGVSYQRRFSSDNPIIKKLLIENKLGKIFSVDLSVKNYRDDAYYNSAEYRGTYSIDGGGPFIQQASHYVDLYQWYFGKPSRIISCLDTFVHDIEVEDHGVAIFKHDNGIIGTMTASTATKPGFPAKMEIYSDLGYLILENDKITHWEIDDLENPSNLEQNNTHTGSSSAIVEDTVNHEFVIKDFINAVKNNSEPLITGEDAKISTEIILDIYRNKF